jgi:hypothetical protein
MLDDVFLLRAEASRSVSWFRPTLVDGTAPSARAGHSANIIPAHTSGSAPFQRVIIFGGGDGEHYLNDLHALDVGALLQHLVYHPRRALGTLQLWWGINSTLSVAVALTVPSSAMSSFWT